jgi:multidrug efflux pump subunit AcrB/outer membrane protein TolC
MNPVKSTLRYPVVALVFAALLVTVGIYAFYNMPKTEDPSITIRTGLVMAEYPGATSEQVEKQVTKVLERHIFKFQEVRKDKTYSTSSHGLTVINVQLEDNVTEPDVFWNTLKHEMNVTAATELPAGVLGPVVKSDFGDTVAMLIAVHGERYGYRELKDYVDKIQDELRKVREIGKMATYGGQAEQVWVTSSTERISQHLVNPLQVIQALRQRNVIENSGSLDTGASDVQLKTTGAFNSEEDIRNVLVNVSRTGEPVYIRDVAEVTRRYEDPAFLLRCNGEPCVLLSIEMAKGNNIVQLGEKITKELDHIRPMLPPDLTMDTVTDQPAVVKHRITTLSHEFMLAIGSVILVTILLLPIRVALISAVAIPVTLSITLGIMNAFGIQLHQVSIAALIVVLGILVDDAIVIADNYVELLDRGVPRDIAAWRSASDVVVPVFTATLTIICAFLPLLILTGSVGEFISALPLTVTIALSVSFIVAVMLTPILCRFFVRKGLHDHDTNKEEIQKKHLSILDRLQYAYGKAINFLMARKPMAVALGVVAVIIGVLLFQLVPRQFFPSAERNQFIIDVWMRQGTRIGATDAAISRIEAVLAGRKDIVQYASFIGQSAPRFYYNVNPQQPDAAYGQLIVRTRSQDETPAIVEQLSSQLTGLVPEAMVEVKELQQGESIEAPVEVRISGENIEVLKKIADSVKNIITDVSYARYVHCDYYNDALMADVDIDTELANRLGLTNAMVAKTLSGSMDGLPVSVFWEGDRPVIILLRLDADERRSFEDIKSTYITSTLTGASVPLRSIASVTPEWETGRIVRRNGVRTITVRSFVSGDHYASELLKHIQPQIAKLPLPEGYTIKYGGEKSNQDETFPKMVTALGISLIAVFLVLLLQFRNIWEPLVIMCSIPLMLPGAIFGLLVTNNVFGFTAFVGIISLTGIVVRNAIILVDYIKEKLAEGHSIVQSATEAGQRRLRPIFLTTMAAAVGVTPMILSRSSLWSPLASVIAVGLIVSMFFTLLIVPVLYVLICSGLKKGGATVMVILFVLTWISIPGQTDAETRSLGLNEAINIALDQNYALRIARAKIGEKEENEKVARSDYFPHLSSETVLSGMSGNKLISIPAGVLGNVPGLGAFPLETVEITQGSDSTFINTLSLKQPLTQILKIRDAEHIAGAETRISEADLRKAEAEVVYYVKKLYLGLLLARKEKEAAMAAMAEAEEKLRESQEAETAGVLLPAAVTGARVMLLQARQSLLAIENKDADISAELSAMTGLPLDTTFELAYLRSDVENTQPLKFYQDTAMSGNPEIQAARETVNKAEFGVSAARHDYIPDVGLFGSYLHQDGISFVKEDISMLGIQMNWDMFDWGKKRATKHQREMQLIQANNNLTRIKQKIEVDVGKAYRNMARSEQLLKVAKEALLLQKERLRIGDDKLTAETITESDHMELITACKKAEYDELQAHVGFYLSIAELELAAGEVKKQEQ